MNVIDFIMDALMYALPGGLLLGALLHYINKSLFKIYPLKIWNTIGIVWILIAILHVLIPEFTDSKAYQYIFAVIVIWGLISIYKYNKKQPMSK